MVANGPNTRREHRDHKNRANDRGFDALILIVSFVGIISAQAASGIRKGDSHRRGAEGFGGQGQSPRSTAEATFRIYEPDAGIGINLPPALKQSVR
jgi:hypothetical protein